MSQRLKRRGEFNRAWKEGFAKGWRERKTVASDSGLITPEAGVTGGAAEGPTTLPPVPPHLVGQLMELQWVATQRGMYEANEFLCNLIARDRQKP